MAPAERLRPRQDKNTAVPRSIPSLQQNEHASGGPSSGGLSACTVFAPDCAPIRSFSVVLIRRSRCSRRYALRAWPSMLGAATTKSGYQPASHSASTSCAPVRRGVPVDRRGHHLPEMTSFWQVRQIPKTASASNEVPSPWTNMPRHIGGEPMWWAVGRN